MVYLLFLLLIVVGSVAALWNLPVENPSGRPTTHRCPKCGHESKQQ